MEKITIKKINGEFTGVCPHCKTVYEDAAAGDVKNYPDDGSFAIFMTCENCGKESEAVFNWKDIFK